jgi:amidase
MARSVRDLGLYLSVMAGADRRDPLSIAEDAAQFRDPPPRDFKGVRVAFSVDLGGLPVDAAVRDVLLAQRQHLEALGCIVEDAAPDLREASEVFQTLRALDFELRLGSLMDAHPGVLKDTVVWNIEQGRRLTGPQIARAQRLRTVLLERMQRFMAQHEFLLCPVNQVPPFSIDEPYVTRINGVEMENYIDWMRSCYYITATTHPALSVPAGFTDEGLPVGIQIIGRHRGELPLLQMGHAFEQATGFGQRRPAL